jgi:hypothetical protein
VRRKYASWKWIRLRKEIRDNPLIVSRKEDWEQRPAASPLHDKVAVKSRRIPCRLFITARVLMHGLCGAPCTLALVYIISTVPVSDGAGTIPKVNEDLCRGWLRKEPVADRRLIPRDVGHRFREGSKKWPASGRNQWPRSVGMGGRLASESVASLGRNTQARSTQYSRRNLSPISVSRMQRLL